MVSETINDQVWGTMGYKGLLNVQSRFDVNVYYKEGMNFDLVTGQAVKDFHEKRVNLIVGHGSDFAAIFNKLAKYYRDIRFSSVLTEMQLNLNFKAEAMVFLEEWSLPICQKQKAGVGAAFDWQPEVQGSEQGANYQNKDVTVDIHSLYRKLGWSR
ncbi:BMP family ABC transporter substrate-binding protein [Peribacillus sp. SCS-155]|uniref:BMP family ABC transporter substrate-binding protein n=1 Tax=Peribacillus sedimenti TaxID=3115297 RepID=UPI0039066265